MAENINEFSKTKKVGFIGAGNMARAIAEGLIQKGFISPADVYVSAPSDSNLQWWRDKGANTTHSNKDIVQKCEVVFLAMKPQYLMDAWSSIPTNEFKGQFSLFVSVLAGVQTESLEELILPKVPFARIVRVLPNTPLLVAAGCSVICGGKSATETDVGLVKGMFSQCGICLEVKESMMDAAGAISACGPAFMYLIIEAVADGGVKMGLPRDTALCLAAETMKGAAQMVIQTKRHPGQLKDEVCSPGGTTIAGMHALEKHAVRSAMITAVEAATTRSKEMGKKC